VDPLQRRPASTSAVAKRTAASTPAATAATAASALVAQEQASRYDAAVPSADVAYVLAVGGFDSVLTAIHVNVTSGVVLSKVPVPDYNNWGEPTRDFAYCPTRNVFYALDVHFTGAEQQRPSTGREVHLSTINPVDGTVVSQKVTGAKGALDYVTGYAVTETGLLHCASRVYNAAGNSTVGSAFYLVNPEDGTATDLGQLDHQNKEDDPAFYGGYHRSVDVTGHHAYRLGYKSVQQQTSPGMSVVTNGTEVHWIDVGTVDSNHGFYLGMTVVPDGVGATALSLAPQSTPTEFLDLVVLHLPSGNATKTIPLGNVTAPGVGLGKPGQLGYVLDASRKGTYVAVVNIPNAFPLPYPGALDSWGVATVDLTTGKATVMNLSPTILSGETSISGVGLPKL
jgi:hypothetical protein